MQGRGGALDLRVCAWACFVCLSALCLTVPSPPAPYKAALLTFTGAPRRLNIDLQLFFSQTSPHRVRLRFPMHPRFSPFAFGAPPPGGGGCKLPATAALVRFPGRARARRFEKAVHLHRASRNLRVL
jgi:hypothetical protein